jgi:hypothetical protein
MNGELVTCSICLRVQRGSQWIDAERVIREIRTYDEPLPRLQRGMCDECVESIFRRRGEHEGPLAA